MPKVIIAAILESFVSNTNVIDSIAVVESISEMNTYVNDNRDETLGVKFAFYYINDESVNFDSTTEELTNSLSNGYKINYTTALVLLCNKEI